MKNYLPLLFVMILSAFSLTSCKTQFSPEIENKIRQAENNLAGWVMTGSDDRWNIEDRMKKYKINGVSIAVIHNYKVEWAQGYGMADSSEKRPVTEKTLFQAASISKSLNSLGVLKMVQDKLIDCDSDINKYLVSWKFPYDAKTSGKKITVKDLLSHTAGLSVTGFPGYERGKGLPSLVQILDGEKPANTGAVRSVTEPGKSFIYSGGGTTITQLIITDLTHIPYDVYMQKEVLDPLGMSESSYRQPPAEKRLKLLATGYKSDGKEVAGKFHVYPEQAAAGLWTTPSDLSLYVIETQRSYRGESSKVLTPEMTRFRLTTVIDDAALGTFVNSRVSGSYKYFNHNGGNEGFSCTAIGCRDSGDGVVIMINSESWPIIEEITNSVATVYNWKDYFLPEVLKPVKVNEQLMKKYEGKYDLSGRIFQIVPGDEGLVIKNGGDSFWKIYFSSDSSFFARESRGVATFQAGPDGKVTGFTTNGLTAKKIE